MNNQHTVQREALFYFKNACFLCAKELRFGVNEPYRACTVLIVMSSGLHTHSIHIGVSFSLSPSYPLLPPITPFFYLYTTSCHDVSFCLSTDISVALQEFRGKELILRRRAASSAFWLWNNGLLMESRRRRDYHDNRGCRNSCESPVTHLINPATWWAGMYMGGWS